MKDLIHIRIPTELLQNPDNLQALLRPIAAIFDQYSDRLQVMVTPFDISCLTDSALIDTVDELIQEGMVREDLIDKLKAVAARHNIG